MSTKKADRKKHQKGALTKKSRLEKADWKKHKKRPVVLGCSLRYQTFQLPDLSELVKKFHGAFYELGQSAHRQRTIFSFDSFLSLFDNHFESIVFTFAYNR